MHRDRLASRATWVLCAMQLCMAGGVGAQEHDHHAAHRMQQDERGMVMNANDSILPRDCAAITADYRFEVAAGTEFSRDLAGRVFAYSETELVAEPCSRITVTFTNKDQVRHQWMVHGLPRYLYPGGMFHLEAAGGHSVSGAFIVPSDEVTYLVHCDLAQHMEMGMKAQLKVGRGDGDLWSVPGVSNDLERATYLPRSAGALLLLAVGAGCGLALLVGRRRGRLTVGSKLQAGS